MTLNSAPKVSWEDSNSINTLRINIEIHSGQQNAHVLILRWLVSVHIVVGGKVQLRLHRSRGGDGPEHQMGKLQEDEERRRK